ncbi:unnamed protein product [Brassicogethes aeneus]|uniref:Uncharacterized protein n=1 Tax=Brassicogethes aeneus TaxID=1431903 RepID=A0A9P0FPN8_BRAAE|nr:unnamed protein product [Brassicogethes aeneus]
MLEPNVKQCISCGPGQMGQCFGPNICCGPFGCLMGTPETLRCRREGFFQDREPCIAGISFCRKNTGRCASEGVCCNQDSCFSDRNCNFEDKKMPENIMGMELYNIMNYQNELSVEK